MNGSRDTGRDAESCTFGALADGSRRTVLRLLSEHGELTASELAGHFDTIGRTAVSTHLRILREAGLVRERRQGRFRYYSLCTQPVEDVVTFLTDLYRTPLERLARTVTEQHHRVDQPIRLTGG